MELVEDIEKMVTRGDYEGSFLMGFYQNDFPEDRMRWENTHLMPHDQFNLRIILLILIYQLYACLYNYCVPFSVCFPEVGLPFLSDL